MPRDDRDPLQAARTTLGDKTEARIRTLAALAKARAELATVKREHGADGDALVRASERYDAARRELDRARGEEVRAKATLGEQLAGLQDPGAAIAGLEREVPILLFPVRLETRFIRFDQPVARPELPPQVGELRVRIYPDGISADSHEPLLSDREVQAGRDYWRTAWRQASEQDAWTALVAEVGAARAAWIVTQCEPVNKDAFPRAPNPASVPEFAERETRPSDWHRPPVARLLPDRWVVQAYPQRAVSDPERARYRVLSRPVLEPLALTLGFADGEGVNLSDGLTVDREIRWTFDFGAAEDVGMAVRIPLEEQDFADGLYRVLVLGVKASLTPEESAGQLAQLIEHHRYSRGLAFVPQGTPTNTTGDAASGYPPPDPRATRSFRVERGAPLTRGGGDGTRVAAALGVPAQTLDHVDGADRDEQRGARAMASALWPATIGYYLRQMLAAALDVPDPHVGLDESTIETLRRHFVEFVRGRGPFPAFRVGDVPYGLVPVSILGHGGVAGLGAADVPPAVAEGTSGVETNLPLMLWRLGQTLMALANDHAPRVGRTADPDADLLDTFRMDASCREVYVRAAVGEDTVDNMAGYAGGNTDRIREPITLNQPIDLGGPGVPIEPGRPDGPYATAPTIKDLLGFPASFPDVVGGHDSGGELEPPGGPEGRIDG